jgi:hypothetical protein
MLLALLAANILSNPKASPSATPGVRASVEHADLQSQPAVHADQQTTEPAGVANPKALPDERVLSQFDGWVGQYLAADASARVSMEANGRALALERRAAMAALIETDPKRAIEQAVPWGVRQKLPPEIVEQLEVPVSARGNFGVLGILPPEGQPATGPGIQRTATIGDTMYQAFVYGRRLALTTKSDIPLHGVAIDDKLALHEDPVRVLDADEAAAAIAANAGAQQNCPVSKEPSTSKGDQTVVDVGGTTMFLCSGGHIIALNEELIAAEGGIGDASASELAASSWTEGPKTLLYVRVRFSDQTNDPQTQASSESMMASVDSFFIENSYQKTTIATTITPVFVLTNNTAWYTSAGIYTVRSHALNAALAAGYNYLDYDLDAVRYNSGPGSFSGAAYVGSRGCWMKSSSAGVAAHEFGHNYGLWHANHWSTSNDSVIGPGTWIEYGDSFDTMGSASAGNNHFNARYKQVLDWLTAPDFVTVAASGTYRIYAHDTLASTNRIRALKVPRDTAKDYWVEFRQKFTSNAWMMNGAGLRRCTVSNSSTGSELLDTTPSTPDGKSDSPLVIGRTFCDTAESIYITPVGKGGTVPESLDVVVNLGPFPGNVSPSVSIGASATTVGTGVTVHFTASSSDGNGDTLAYYWDFGDKSFGSNNSTASKSWSTAGEYVVRCTVTDMKGGQASDSVVVRVGSPTTYRVSGQVFNGGGPVEGVRVHNGLGGTSYRGTYTDSDGTYTITGLAAGTTTVSAAKFEYGVTPSGFSNPIILGPNATGINFIATPLVYSITGTVTDNGFGISGAMVTDGVRTSITTASGSFSITNLQNGTYTLSATKPGYELDPTNSVIEVNGGNASASFYRRLYYYNGLIYGTTASVTVGIGDGVHQSTSGSYGGTQGGTTNNSYSVGVPSGTWNLQASLAGAVVTPANFTNPITVTPEYHTNFNFNAVITNAPPTVATPASASPNPVTGTTTAVSVLGADNGGEPSLSYSWSSTGPSYVSFSASGNNLAKNATATFYQSGNYVITATIADTSGQTVTSSFPLTVIQTLSSIVVSPSNTTVLIGGTQQFSATGRDQFGYMMSPTFSWSVTGGGTISASGLFTATSAGGPFSVIANSGGSYGYASVTVQSLPQISVNASDPTAAEAGPDTGLFTITRTANTNSSVTVSYSVTGSATGGSDYSSIGTSVVIPAGATSVGITVTPTNDLIPECSESVVLTLSSSSSYTIGAPSSATVTIADNDLPTASLYVADGNAAEQGSDTGSFTVTRNGCPSNSLTISYTITGTASNGVDYATLTGSVTIPANNSSATIAISPSDDPLVEGSETVVLTLASSASYQIGTPNGVTVTIADNDSNAAPTVNAGPDQTNSILTATALNGTASDDGQPSNSWTTAWSRLSGPGNVAFDDPSAAATMASFTMAGTYTLRLTGNDGGLTSSDDAIITVVAADPADVVAAINAGGSQFTDATGVVYEADKWFSGGATSSTANSIGGTGSAALYQSQREGNFSYAIPVAEGTNDYDVALKFSEIEGATAGQRVFDVSLEGALAVDDLDLAAEAGANQAWDIVLPVTVSDGTLNIQFQASTGSVQGAQVSAILVASPAVAPAKPVSFTATAVSSSQINLAWTDQSGNETDFELESSADGVNFTPLATLGANVTSYPHTGLNAGAMYYYRLRACNAAGCSSFITANATTQQAAPLAPTNLSATGVPKKINLSWTQSATGGVTQNKVYRSTSSTGPYTLIATLTATTSYQDRSVTRYVRYYYVVTAVKSGLESGFSNQANAASK